MRNRQWLLKRRPTGQVVVDDFEYAEAEISEPSLGLGQILLRNKMLLLAPTVRNAMNAQIEPINASIPLGSPPWSPAASEVVASRHDEFEVGDRIYALGSWQDYQVVVGDSAKLRKIPTGLPLSKAMGVFGSNALTAYFGLLKVGMPEKGETLVVSGAAGSTGSMAAQLGKLKGCRVIGIAGGREKCDWLVQSCGLDAAVDYKSGDLTEALSAHCPEGIDIFYDNVGGPVLQVALNLMARHGRIVLCGQIDTYDRPRSEVGLKNLLRLVYAGVRMQGFLMSDFQDQFEEALSDLRRWEAERQLVHPTDIRRGFGQIPASFMDLFRGANRGTLLADISEP